MQSNGPRASKLEADGVEAERERRPCKWLRKYDRQCTHRSSQVKEGFFLCQQRCSVGHALASHVRGQRKFNP
jgi:hypothetical protein